MRGDDVTQVNGWRVLHVAYPDGRRLSLAEAYDSRTWPLGKGAAPVSPPPIRAIDRDETAPPLPRWRDDHPLLGVFCIEGEWGNRLDERISVEPMLQMLEQLRLIRFIRRDAATDIELEHYLRRWRRYSSYRLLYLGFHGERDHLEVQPEGVSLDWVAERIGDAAEGRTVHFASCSVLDLPSERLARFCRETGARGVSGYRRDVHWLESAAFELALIQSLQQHPERPSYAYRFMHDYYGGQARALGFVHHPES